AVCTYSGGLSGGCRFDGGTVVVAASVTVAATWGRLLRLWLSPSAAALVALSLWIAGQWAPAGPLRAIAPPRAVAPTLAIAPLGVAALVALGLVAAAFGELTRRRT